MPQMRSRQEVCSDAAAALRQSKAAVGELSGLIGFDGFVDEICAVVEKREDALVFEPVPNIARLAEKIAAAAGRSSNYELVVRRTKPGGNGPIMAGAMAELGMRMICIGALGWPEVHPVFAQLSKRARVYGIAPPAHTDALEFADGKLMLGKLDGLSQITWENLQKRLGAERVAAMFSEARMIGIVNWTMLPHATALWVKLTGEVLQNLPPAPRTIFIDLADPEKRPGDDLRQALRLAGGMQAHAQTVLGLNLKEAQQVCDTLGLPQPRSDLEALARCASDVRAALGIACCVIHPRAGAAAATEERATTFSGPFVREPAISTGAGDHFNAGFMLARMLELPLDECLCAGCAASGYYVRHGTSPDLAQLSAFISSMPEPE